MVGGGKKSWMKLEYKTFKHAKHKRTKMGISIIKKHRETK